MKTKIAIFVVAAVLAGCATRSSDKTVPKADKADRIEKVETKKPEAIVPSMTIDSYKRSLAQRIVQVNSSQVYAGQPQALLRSVIVVRFAVDAHGNVMHSEIIRSNRDSVTEATALASLRNAGPLPKPTPNLLQHGRVEISETWLFNSDGRFQLRSIAEQQMDH